MQYVIGEHTSEFTGATTYTVNQRLSDGREIWACSGYDHTSKPYSEPIYKFFDTPAAAEAERLALIASFRNLDDKTYQELQETTHV